MNHNFIICCDDTSKFSGGATTPVSNILYISLFVSVLFSTNLSTELFEYAHAFAVTPEELKARMVRNVDIIFDEACKEPLREIIQNYRI